MPKPSANVIRDKLRSLPIDERAQLIVELFRIIAAEFAAMVLEHVKPPPKKPISGRRSKAATAGTRGRQPSRRAPGL